MARGYIYYLTTDPDFDISFSEYDYSENADTMGFSYAEYLSISQSQNPIDSLKTLFENIYGEVNNNNKFAFTAKFSDITKTQYAHFEPKLNKVKDLAGKLTLYSVTQSAPNLDYILNNDCGDLITLFDGTAEHILTIDDFVRQIKPNETYYVHPNVILMH